MLLQEEFQKLKQQEEKEQKLKIKKQTEQKVRDSLKVKKLPGRIIVRARTTDSKSEIVETQPASFTIEEDPQQPGNFLRDGKRGYFYEELNVITDERSPVILSLINQEPKSSQKQKAAVNQSQLSMQISKQLEQQIPGCSSFQFQEIALTTIAIPILEAAQRLEELYLIRYVDEDRGFALNVGLCVHHMKMIRRMFEAPKIGIQMQ
ncbi:MAG: hypothetical protein EZS28_050007, partial [Streblomastix strix]